MVLWSLQWTIIRCSGFSVGVELAQSFLYNVEQISLLGGIHPTSLQTSMVST